jgi:hypothetical protein
LLASPSPKLGALAGVVAACLCTVALWPSAALAEVDYLATGGSRTVHIASEGQTAQLPDLNYETYAYANGGSARAPQELPEGLGTDGTLVEYHSDVRWEKVAYKVVWGPFQCTNETFGKDPDPGHTKSCYTHLFSDLVAAEGQNFQRPANGFVAYGQTNSGITWVGNTVWNEWASKPDGEYGNWIIKHVDGPASCTNSYFGADPWQGVKKYCWQVWFG